MPHESSDRRLFLGQARREFLQTGAIVPSSRFLARSVTWPLARRSGPLAVLEAGAGTGALTAELIARLPGDSRLDVYEINPVFAAYLERRFGNGGGVRVRNAPVQDLPLGAEYDVIVCGLPLNNLRPSEVRQILNRLFEALRPGGTLTFFEYLLIRELKSLATGRRGRRRLRRVGLVTGSFLEKYEIRRDAVMLNIPPAIVHHLRKPA